MEDKQNFNIGDLVELKVALRRPKLKGIILRDLGYNNKIDDFVYEVYSLTLFGTLGHVNWTDRTLTLLSSGA